MSHSAQVVFVRTGRIVEMSRQKTATYSFEPPLHSAADPLRGVTGDRGDPRTGRVLCWAWRTNSKTICSRPSARPDEHGKDAYSDLREGKETAIIAVARRTSAWPLIEPHFGAGDLSSQEGATVRSLLSDCGAEGEIRALIDELSANARELVAAEPMLIGPDMARLLDELIEALDGRRS